MNKLPCVSMQIPSTCRKTLFVLSIFRGNWQSDGRQEASAKCPCTLYGKVREYYDSVDVVLNVRSQYGLRTRARRPDYRYFHRERRFPTDEVLTKFYKSVIFKLTYSM